MQSTANIDSLTPTQAMSSLLESLQAELAAYQPVFEKYYKQAKKQSFTHIAYHIMSEWNEQIKAETESLTIFIRDYLNQQEILNAASPEIKDLREKYDAIIGISKTQYETFQQIEALDKNTNPKVSVNIFSNKNIAIAKQLNELRKTRLNQQKQFLAKCASNEKEKQSPFEGLIYVGPKSGGANDSGEFGGWYKDKDGNLYLVKKEAQVEKVIGEYWAGMILEPIYKYLGVPETNYAKIDLIRPRNADKNNKTGNDVYVKSLAIPCYKGDLWKYAWPVLPEKPSFWRWLWNATWDITPTVPEVPSRRPPGLFHPKSLKWTDDFIITNNLQEEFAKLAAPRPLVGDFGGHNGNFGIRKNETEDNNPHIAALDYGAAGYNFSDELKLYLPFYGLTDFYKNHFLDYGPKVNASEAMANTLIAIGTMPTDELKKASNKAFNKIFGLFNENAIGKFSKRIGKPDTSHADISDYTLKQMLPRQKALKKQGYALLLEHCVRSPYGNPHVDRVKLNGYLKKHKGLKKFLRDEFNNYPLVYHKGLVGPAAWFVDRKIPIFSDIVLWVRHKIDNRIRKAIHDAANGKVNTSIWEKMEDFFVSNLEIAYYSAFVWAWAAVAITLFLPVSAIVMLPAFAVGALAGIIIGYTGCLIRDGIKALINCCTKTNDEPSFSDNSSTLSSSGEILSATESPSVSPLQPSKMEPSTPSTRQRRDSLKAGEGFIMLPSSKPTSSSPAAAPKSDSQNVLHF